MNEPKCVGASDETQTATYDAAMTVVDPYSIHRELESYNSKAWSAETVVNEPDSSRGPVTTALLIVALSVLALVVIWFLAKFFGEQQTDSSSVVPQQITQSPASTESAPTPTLSMPDTPNIGGIDQDSRYVALLGQRGVVTVSSSKSAAVESAHDLCKAKAGNYTTAQMIAAVVQSNPNLRADLAPVVVRTAIETYCPS